MTNVGLMFGMVALCAFASGIFIIVGIALGFTLADRIYVRVFHRGDCLRTLLALACKVG